VTARQPLWYSLLAIMVTAFVLAGTGFWYTNHVQRQGDQRWCDLLVTMDDAYSAGTPTTEIGRKIAALMRKLRADFDC
jgi:hypothetical protein